ncbi:hypothetical protein AB0392_13355 [Nonomuraea angiospora]|uniref:hypothetical protein n=1 Tax=Nonomuraea angiospora TaxID=46172 RepID=UPI00344C94FE
MDVPHLLRVVLSIFFITGCASTGVRVEGDDPVIFVHGSSVSMKAEFSGVLTFDGESRCLRLGSASGTGTEAMPVWPDGTTPIRVKGKRGVTVPGVGVIVEGDRFRAGGGGSTWRANPPQGVIVPEDCLPPGAEGTVFIIGEVDDVQPSAAR